MTALIKRERLVTFLARLRRRKVVQWSVAYAAGAWGALQGLSYATETFGWSAALQPLATVGVLVGLPIVVVIAWYHGDRGQQTVTRTELAILTALLVIGGAIFWSYQRSAHVVHGGRQAGPGQPVSAQEHDAPPNSIAVLPFVNMSGDPENEYFSDGVSEEILNVLARSPGLQVAARTSSFAYKGKALEVPEIARELDVRMILEGSVRKQGDKVRITAQMVDAQTGFHVWSETYDRRLADIFAIQDEIARAIGEKMQVRTVSPGVARAQGALNPKAHDHYLRGLGLWQQRQEAALWQAIEEFNLAIELEPGYAAAYGGLAMVYSVLQDYSAQFDFAETRSRTSDAAEMALALDPTLPEPYAALGQVAGMQYRREVGEALLRRAVALAPSYATAQQWLGLAIAARGDPEGGVGHLETARTLDPRSTVIAENYAAVLMNLGRYEDAIAACRKALAIVPDDANCLRDIAISELMLGRPEAARAPLVAAAEGKGADAVRQAEELVDAFVGRSDRNAAARRLASFPLQSYLQPGSGNAIDPIYVPLLLMGLGEPELTLDYVERNTVPGGYAAFLDLMLSAKALDPIRCDSRMRAVEQRLAMNVLRTLQVCGGANSQP